MAAYKRYAFKEIKVTSRAQSNGEREQPGGAFAL
jgi:hypothetical protein